MTPDIGFKIDSEVEAEIERRAYDLMNWVPIEKGEGGPYEMTKARRLAILQNHDRQLRHFLRSDILLGDQDF
jgi:hypothetical protein